MDPELTRLPSELPNNVRQKVREDILAWISKDVGLSQFCVPQGLAKGWSPEQVQAWTNSVIANYIPGKDTDADTARLRVLAREAAGNLRRLCVKLRKEQITHSDAASMSVALEGLWDDLSPDLSDHDWARCSLMFDTALASLRVVYIWLYLKTENTGDAQTTDTRKDVFSKLVSSFFVSGAPTDDAHDKHSTNFRDLLSVWKKELSLIAASDDFEKKLSDLESSESLERTAGLVERFINALNQDRSWIMKMKDVETKIEDGSLFPSTTRGRKKKKQPQPRKESMYDYYSDDGMQKSISSPDIDKSDADYELQNDNNFIVSTSADDDVTDSSEEYMRKRRRRKRSGGNELRRSARNRAVRVSKTRPTRNGMPAREVRKPERFSPEEKDSPYYASRTRGPIRPVGRRSKTNKQNGRVNSRSIFSSEEDDVPLISGVAPKRARKEIEAPPPRVMVSDSDDPQPVDTLPDLDLKNSNFRLHGDDDFDSDNDDRADNPRLHQRTSRKGLRDNGFASRNYRRTKESVFSTYDDELPSPQVEMRRAYRSNRE